MFFKFHTLCHDLILFQSQHQQPDSVNMNGRRSHLWGFVGWLTKVDVEYDIGFKKRKICRVNNFSTCLSDIVILGAKSTICRVNNCTTCLESRAGSADLFHAAALTISVWHNQQKTLKVCPDNMWVWHNQLNPESGKGSVTVKNSDFFAKKRAPNSSTKWTPWVVFGCWPLRSFRAVFLQRTTQNPGHFECVTNNKNWSCMW